MRPVGRVAELGSLGVMSAQRKFRLLACGLGFLVIVFLFLKIFQAPRQGSPLSLLFVGLTNNPVSQFRPYRIAVAGNPSGLCALFQLKNTGFLRAIGFETSGLEVLTEDGWEQFSPTGAWQGIVGDTWFPGSGCLFAVGWPPGLSTNASWRLVVRSRLELTIPGEVINQWSGKRIFSFDKRMKYTALSTPVVPPAPNQTVQRTGASH